MSAGQAVTTSSQESNYRENILIIILDEAVSQPDGLHMYHPKLSDSQKRKFAVQSAATRGEEWMPNANTTGLLMKKQQSHQKQFTLLRMLSVSASLGWRTPTVR
ncbi:hypothetical protein HHI36_016889 [Cryptolaemus montrouzieri]|uniref:Uncharacterized protein n=1 Tax=Cryptolaemus montrouzieri TaxID=559131 RepID=A0ABD2NLH4_9CUCU